MKHIHLDAPGGVAGDMLVAAAIDLDARLQEKVSAQLRLLHLQKHIDWEWQGYDDGVLCGKKFLVKLKNHAEDALQNKQHAHRHWAQLRKQLLQAPLDPNVSKHSVGIFEHLAAAEAQVHNKHIDEVAFHEVGQWDSVADIVAAAVIIKELDAKWSVSALPLGRGRVKSQHGMLPLPAPAVVLLLKGFCCFDDGLEGERITPTGAAILRYLQPSQQSYSPAYLSAVGQGFGQQRLKNTSNVLRLLCFESSSEDDYQDEELLALSCDIDDQSPEELALALENLRQQEGVLDVLYNPAIGKKGRSIFQVQVLSYPEHEKNLLRQCFVNLTTLGIRRQILRRSSLKRREHRFKHEGSWVRVKVSYSSFVTRAKMEADDRHLLGQTAAEREFWQRHYESLALEKDLKSEVSDA